MDEPTTPPVEAEASAETYEVRSEAVVPSPPITVARLVHWFQPGASGERDPRPLAALVVDVDEDGLAVTLSVSKRTGGTFLVRNVEYAEERTPGCWSYPPRV